MGTLIWILENGILWMNWRGDVRLGVHRGGMIVMIQ